MKCDLTQAAKMIGCWRLTVPRSFLVTWRRSGKRSGETERADADRVRLMMTGCVRSRFGASGPSLDSIWHRGATRSCASGHLFVEQVRARAWRGPAHPVLLCWVSGHDLMRGAIVFTFEIVWSTLNVGATWRSSGDQMLEACVRSPPTSASGHPVVSCPLRPTALFREGFYLNPMASSSSLPWPFALT
jgi:hypothetical protein